MGYAEQHMRELIQIIEKMDLAPIEKMADLLAQVKADGGRIFFLGVGGSAGNCSHAVNDFRKIVGIECYAPTDNVSELTARTNDEGWATIFVEWLKISKLLAKDVIFVFSVGGGNLEKNISPNLVTALQYAKSVGAKVIGVVGRDGGYTAKVADACVIVPTVNPDNVTPHSEAFQAVVWHLLVSHPKLKANQTKWEFGGRDRERRGMRTRAVFLDRDGVLNCPVIREGRSYPPARVEDVEVYVGLRDPLQRLKDRGFVLIVVTNQPDVARGTTPRETVEGINSVIAREIPAIDRFMVCFHDNGDGCDCRKPRPGMLLAGAAEFNVDLARSYMVGDRRTDVEAGIAAGSRTIFIDRAYSEPPPTHYDHRVSSTLEALTIIESETKHEKS